MGFKILSEKFYRKNNDIVFDKDNRKCLAFSEFAVIRLIEKKTKFIQDINIALLPANIFEVISKSLLYKNLCVIAKQKKQNFFVMISSSPLTVIDK